MDSIIRNCILATIKKTITAPLEGHVGREIYLDFLCIGQTDKTGRLEVHCSSDVNDAANTES